MELPKAITSNPAQGLANLSGGNKAQLSDQLLEKARVNIDTALKDLESRLSGLSAAEVEARIKMVNTTATVVRDNTDTEVPLKLLVPGDIIRLNAGDMVPADVRLLSAKDLFLNQAALTGESLPVEKKAAPPRPTFKPHWICRRSASWVPT